MSRRLVPSRGRHGLFCGSKRHFLVNRSPFCNNYRERIEESHWVADFIDGRPVRRELRPRTVLAIAESNSDERDRNTAVVGRLSHDNPQ
jgi:hypothetical protein